MMISVVLGIMLASRLSGQHFIVAIERHTSNGGQTANPEKANKISSRFKRFFGLTSKSQQPVMSVKGFKIGMCTFKYAHFQSDPEKMITSNESSTTVPPDACVVEFESENEQKKREQRQKDRDRIKQTREELKNKYNSQTS
ncbi:unnamed protein product [Rotaria sordida]|uniref:Uncharacterized protein n=1 Tax=Rotaria sordida TaxID=392033 RepID=A0A814R951_9BILA|nr:unnamed protein product [Rotaria sordida]CAF1130034.1 unnamed protein product [Rotaria sordida]CAF3836936.1 unnamed protein product [Rotaria sordida]CAF3965487.1 unnamed protein product [Rotaria sordida]